MGFLIFFIFLILRATWRQANYVVYSLLSFYANFQVYERRNSQPTSTAIAVTASLKPSLVPLELKMPSSDTKTVFRNQLQRHKSLSNYPITLEGASIRPKPWSISPKVTVMTPATLPEDFRAKVATLPPIEIKPNTPTDFSVQSLAIDTEFIKSKLKKNSVISNL